MPNPKGAALKPLIAVVDDEKDLLENFKFLLEDDFEVAAFSDPQSFLKDLPKLVASNLRLVVIDYKMPGLTGLETIQKMHLQNTMVPFIVLSGYLDKRTVIEAVEMGVFRILEKPCPPQELLSAIDQLLIEAELQTVRQEIRQITSQLRELFSSIRVALLQYIPEDIVERMVVDAPEGDLKQKMSFEDLLEKLEHRLDHLLETERLMNDLSSTRSKKTA